VKRELEQLQKRLRGLEDVCKASSCVDYTTWNHYQRNNSHRQGSTELIVSLIATTNRCGKSVTCIRSVVKLGNISLKLAIDVIWNDLLEKVKEKWDIDYCDGNDPVRSGSDDMHTVKEDK